jgi:hypothetical protein
MFKDGRTNVDHEERSGRPSVMKDNFVRSDDQKITISERSHESPQISRTDLY